VWSRVPWPHFGPLSAGIGRIANRDKPMGVGMMLRSACCVGVLLPLLLLAAVEGTIPLAGDGELDWRESNLSAEKQSGVQTCATETPRDDLSVIAQTSGGQGSCVCRGRYSSTREYCACKGARQRLTSTLQAGPSRACRRSPSPATKMQPAPTLWVR
jgi:hypothetical protein